MSYEQDEGQFGESSRLPKPRELRARQASGSTMLSSRAASLEAALADSLRLEAQLAESVIEETPQQSLKRLLSVRSVVSTSSSLAERHQAAVGTTVTFREIGTGSIGKVFEHPGTTWAYKLPVTDDTTRLWNNYTMARRIVASFDHLGEHSGEVVIPRAIWYAQAETKDFWDENLDKFAWSPQFGRKRRDVLCVERIFPLPKPTRDRLIELYCPPAGREAAKNYQANKDCLLRPLLGRERQSSQSVLKSFSLRNFKLHLDQIKEIGLDTQEITFAMADAMAVLHWQTRIDAMDIEFVLGSSPQNEQQVRRDIPLDLLLTVTEPTSTFEYVTNYRPNFAKRVTSLWLLDFDACSEISMDQEGVNKACKAFVETDPYCPRPNKQNIFAQQLWIDFGKRYLATAGKFIDRHYQLLPARFLQGVEDLLEHRSQPMPSGPPITYTPRRGSAQLHGGTSASRGGSSSSNRPATYVPTGALRGTSFGPGSRGGSELGGTGRGRSDDGSSGGRRGSGSGPSSRGGSGLGGMGRGTDDGNFRGRRGSGSNNDRGSGRRFDAPWRG
ncbi:MAG: hypothetical protein Q9202_004807 [Teloschistes flavicans]